MAAQTINMLRIDDVVAKTGLSRATIWRRIAYDGFPAPKRLGGQRTRAVGWREADIDEWLESLQEVA